MLGLPLAGSYHTELTAYAQLRSGDPRIVLAVHMALTAFYGRCDLVLSPSRSADARLAELGVEAVGMRVLGQLHGFLRRPETFDASEPVVATIAGFVRQHR